MAFANAQMSIVEIKEKDLYVGFFADKRGIEFKAYFDGNIRYVKRKDGINRNDILAFSCKLQEELKEELKDELLTTVKQLHSVIEDSFA